MAVSKEKKGQILADIKKIIADSGSIVFVNFHALPIAESTQLRRSLREKGAGFLVAKKTLIRKAMAEAAAAGTIIGVMPELPGEAGIAYSKDSLASAQGVYEFQKKLDKKVQIVGGVFEGKYMALSEMVTIAQIPGLNTLQAQFVNLINSPIQRLVIGLNAIAEKKA
jgi:large subunit ribosomal protein L10